MNAMSIPAEKDHTDDSDHTEENPFLSALFHKKRLHKPNTAKIYLQIYWDGIVVAAPTATDRRYRAGQGSNDSFRTWHALATGSARAPQGNFLCRQKVTKELPRGDAECRAPARQSRSPLGTPLGTH